MTEQQPIALLSVYDKAGLLPFAQGLAEQGVRLLGSGGTAKAIRNAGMEIGYAGALFDYRSSWRNPREGPQARDGSWIKCWTRLG